MILKNLIDLKEGELFRFKSEGSVCTMRRAYLFNDILRGEYKYEIHIYMNNQERVFRYKNIKNVNNKKVILL